MTRAMTRWHPFNDMVDVMTLRDAMNQLFEDSFVQPSALRSGDTLAAPMDVSETPNAFVVEMAVAGLRPDDLNVTVENNVLTVIGEIRREESTEAQHYHRVERRFGRFQRALTLPSTVKVDDIKATMEHGVLRLDIPKAEEMKPRRISVNVQSN